MIPFFVVKLTAQIVSKEGSQIPTSINQKFDVRNVVFLGESVQERCHGIGPAAAVYVEPQIQQTLANFPREISSDEIESPENDFSSIVDQSAATADALAANKPSYHELTAA